MKNILIGIIIGLALAIGGYTAILWLDQQNQFEITTLPTYSQNFNKEANATANLKEAMKKATKEQKNILLIGGGDWCRWCGTMSNFLEEHPKLQKEFYSKFEVVRFYYGKGMNFSGKVLVTKYGKPIGTPHFYLLSNQAELLNSFGTRSLERGYGYNQSKFLAFIEKYSKIKTITKDKK